MRAVWLFSGAVVFLVLAVVRIVRDGGRGHRGLGKQCPHTVTACC